MLPRLLSAFHRSYRPDSLRFWTYVLSVKKCNNERQRAHNAKVAKRYCDQYKRNYDFRKTVLAIASERLRPSANIDGDVSRQWTSEPQAMAATSRPQEKSWSTGPPPPSRSAEPPSVLSVAASLTIEFPARCAAQGQKSSSNLSIIL